MQFYSLPYQKIHKESFSFNVDKESEKIYVDELILKSPLEW